MSGGSPGLCGQCRLSACDCDSTSSSFANRKPAPARRRNRDRRRRRAPCMSRARANRATSFPIFPQPTRPRVLPSSSMPWRRSQRPALSAASPKGIERASASSRPKASSATPRAFAPSARSTAMPRRFAASRSTLSTPVPFLLMAFRPLRGLEHPGGDLLHAGEPPEQPGTRRSSSSSSGCFPGVEKTTSWPAFLRSSRAGSPSLVSDRGVTRILPIALPLRLGTISIFPAFLNTRTGKPSFSMSP